jgi:nucleoside-diphosphate-sugar epimerase
LKIELIIELCCRTILFYIYQYNLKSQSLNFTENKVKTILVTGGTGLVGTHLLKKLSAAGKKIKALYRSKIPENTAANIEWIQGDILDVITLEDAMQNTDIVFHCAAVVSFNPKKKEELFKTNVEGTANVVNTAIDAGIEKLVHVSSVAALGKQATSGKMIDEKTVWNEKEENSRYAKTKFAAEREVWRGIGEGLNAVIVNPSIILGSGDWTKTSTEIFKTIHDGLSWYSEGINGFVDVEDVVNALMLLSESNINAERFVLSGTNATYKQVFDLVAQGFGKKTPHKKITPVLAGLVWRLKAIQSLFTRQAPMITKETAETALSISNYDGSKITQSLPQFQYTPLEDTIARVCRELKGFAEII